MELFLGQLVEILQNLRIYKKKDYQIQKEINYQVGLIIQEEESLCVNQQIIRKVLNIHIKIVIIILFIIQVICILKILHFTIIYLDLMLIELIIFMVILSILLLKIIQLKFGKELDNFYFFIYILALIKLKQIIVCNKIQMFKNIFYN